MKIPTSRSIAVLALIVGLSPPFWSAAEAQYSPEKLSWGFLNFGTTKFEWDRYRETYVGIPSNPVLSSGFDILFYDLLYKSAISKDGNCFGISLMSALLNERGGHLGFCAPVGAYTGDTNPLVGVANRKPDIAELRRAIEETHGHQLNLRTLKFFLDGIHSGKATSGDQVFQDAKNQTDQGKLALVGMIQGSKGHTILAYATEIAGNEKRILVYDPNRTWANPAVDQQGWYTNHKNFIKVVNDVWEFDFDGGTPWSGGNNVGTNFMTIFPLPLVAPRDRNPASLGFSVDAIIKQFVVSGAGASLKQMSDAQDLHLFEPGSRRIERDPEKGLLNAMPMIPSDGGAAGTSAPENYFLFGVANDPLDLEVRSGTEGYTLHAAGKGSALRITARGGQGTDLVRVSDVGTFAAGVTLVNAIGADAYDVDLVLVVEPGKDARAFKLRDVVLPQGAMLDLSLRRDGTTLRAVSPFQSVRFDLEIVRETSGGEESLAIPGVDVEAGARREIRPRDWDHLDASSPYVTAATESAASIERYTSIVYGAAGGPVGPDFDGARDVGAALPGVPSGSTTYHAPTGLYTQVSSGEEIGEGGDSFQFAYQSVRGDFEFTVEILERTNPPVSLARLGRHGLMARRDTTAAARFSQVQTNTGGDAIEWPRWAYRSRHGNPNAPVEEHTFNYPPDQWPRFMKLVRRGKTFHGFLSRDGLAWDPVGSDTWLDQSPRSPVLVGFASTSHRSAQGQPSRFRFRVLQLGPIENEIPPPIHDDGLSTGRVIHESAFDGSDGAVPAGFNVQKRDGAFTPSIAGGRLRLTSELVAGSATSAFLREPLATIDEHVFQFDFDLLLARREGSSPSGGVAFCLSAGSDASRVGFGGAALGYLGMGQKVGTDENVSTNDIAVAFALDPSASSPGGEERYRLSILTQGSLAPVATALRPLAELLDPQGLHVRVLYNAGKVSALVGANAAAGGALAPALEAQVLPLTFLNAESAAVAGFTASTGDEAATAEVDAFQITAIDCDDIPEVAEVLGVPAAPVPAGAQITLDGSASNGGAGDENEPIAYAWKVLSGPATISGPDHGPTVNLSLDGPGEVRVQLTVDDGHCQNPASKAVQFTAGGAAANWIRCDCNGDGGRDLSDPIVLLAYLFLAGSVTCPDACNCNGDLDGGRAVVDISDAIFDLNYQFLGGPSPALPYPACEAFAGCGDHCP